MRPTFQILAAGKDITTDISDRFISMDIVDSVDEMSDGLVLVLEDVKGTLAIPASGARLEIAIGYNGKNQRLGSFVVDDVDIEGPPDVISIQATSSPFVNDRGGKAASELFSRRSRSLEGKTFGEIVATVAGKCGLTPVVDKKLASVVVPHVDQSNESDANMLIRLGRRFGATLKPADGKLVMVSDAGGMSASGQPIEITLTPSQVSSWRITLGGKSQAVTAVKVKQHDYKQAKVIEHIEPVAPPQPDLTDELPQPDQFNPTPNLEDQPGYVPGDGMGMVLPPKI